MKRDKLYKNITTGQIVKVLEVHNFAGTWVEYRRLGDNKEFIKPGYVFLQTYKQVINML